MGVRSARRGDAVVMVAARAPSDPDSTWQQRALCRGADPNLFFAPNHPEKPEERQAREAKAKAICAQCPVRRECLEYALDTREPHGIWGGTNETERREIITKRAV